MSNKDVTLHEVLYAPTFKYNLLSISKLCKQHHCIAIFTDEYCLMQAPSMKRLQVLGGNHGGLYLMEHDSQTQSRISEYCTDRNKELRIVSFSDKSPSVCTSSLQHDSAFV